MDGSVAEYGECLCLINRLLKKIGKASPKRDHTWTEPASHLSERAWLNGRTVNVTAIWLTPTGCEWANRSGCTMCGEWSGSQKADRLPAEYHVAQFATAVARYARESRWLKVFQEGSFLNPNEVDPAAQQAIVRLCSMVQGMERVTVESRAQYVTEETIGGLVNVLDGSVELELGMGLEARDEVVRNVCVNKGASLFDYQRALRVAQQARVRTLAYVLIKPPFLTEKEAIDEAINTVHLAFELGFDAVGIEPASIHEWSLVELLHFHGLYAPPWLWTVLEVVKQTRQLGDLRIGGSEYYPGPAILAHNRHGSDQDCNEQCWAAIRQYNETHDGAVLHEFEHSCTEKWQAELAATLPPLGIRIPEMLAQVAIQDYLEHKSASTLCGLDSSQVAPAGPLLTLRH